MDVERRRAAVFAVALVLLAPAVPVEAGTYPSGWPMPIIIGGDSAFTADNWVAAGSGTPDDPYIITGWTGYTSVEVRDSTAHFVIRNVSVGKSGSYASAIYLYNVMHARIENIVVEDGDYSVSVLASADVIARGVRGSRAAAPPVLISASSDIAVEQSNLFGVDGTNWYGYYTGKAAVDVQGGSNVTVSNNTLSGGKAAGLLLSSVTNAVASGNHIVVGLDRAGVEVTGGEGAVLRANSFNFTYNRTGTAIRLTGTSTTAVEWHNLTGGEIGIRLDYDRNSTLRENSLRGFSGYGVWLVESDGASLLNNTFVANAQGAYPWRGAGIGLRGSTDISMHGNTFEADGMAFDRWGASTAYTSHNITPDNLVNGDPLIYRARCTNETVDGRAGQVFVADCPGVRVANVTVGPAAAGIFLYNAPDAVVEDVAVEDTHHGIEVTESDRVLVRRARVNASDYAVEVSAANAFALRDATITNSGRGVHADFVTGLDVAGSIFVGNGRAFYLYNALSDVTISNCTISSNDQGIHVANAGGGMRVLGNNISDNRYGAALFVEPGAIVEIKGNVVNANRQQGLSVYDSPGAVVEENTFEGNVGGGLLIVNSTGAVVRDNRIESTRGPGLSVKASWDAAVEGNAFVNDGMAVAGSLAQLGSLRVAANNTANEKPVIYKVNCSDLELDGASVGQLLLVNCDRVSLSNLEIDSTDTAVWVLSSRDVTVANSSFRGNDGAAVSLGDVHGGSVRDSVASDTQGGAILVSGTGIEVKGNKITNATGVGVRATNAADVRVFDNAIERSRNGFSCMDCDGVTVENNSITGSWGPRLQFYTGCGSPLDASAGPILCPAIWIPPTEEGDAVALFSTSHATVVGNTLSFNNGSGVRLGKTEEYQRSRYPLPTTATISQNWIERNNGSGVYVGGYRNVLVFHNNFINNSIQANASKASESLWDDGYPNGGNYWSNFTAPDAMGGPDQDEATGPDGILDRPYDTGFVLDRYPLASAYPFPPPRDDAPAPLPPGSLPAPLNPENPPPTQTLYVLVQVHLNGSAPFQNATLHYRWFTQDDFTLLPMQPAGGSLYAAHVPIPATRGHLEYFVTADERPNGPEPATGGASSSAPPAVPPPRKTIDATSAGLTGAAILLAALGAGVFLAMRRMPGAKIELEKTERRP